MARYCIKSPEVNAIKRLFKKLDYFEINTPEIKGKLKIVGYRKYKWDCEVDVEFKGKARMRCGRNTPEFFDSSILKRPRVSKVKVNRIIRRYIQTTIDNKMKYVCDSVRLYSCIKKLTWK